MDMPVRKDWPGIPAKMRMLLLHVRHSEGQTDRYTLPPQPDRPANEADRPIVIMPIAHRRTS